MSDAILVADDNPTIRSLLIRLIKRVRPEAHILDAASATDALAVCHRDRPMMVLLDHGLPDMSGFAVLQQLKVQHEAPYVIVITGNPQLESEALARGADEVWLKPMDVQSFLHHLTMILPAA